MTEHNAIHLRGHQPLAFKGQKAAVLNLLLEHRGEWVPSWKLSRIALQYAVRVGELRKHGYDIQNEVTQVGRERHGAFRLVSCPGETAQGVL